MPVGQDAVGRGEKRDFEMGLGLLKWPDSKEFWVRSEQYERPVPFARLCCEIGDDGRNTIRSGSRWDEARVMGGGEIGVWFQRSFWEAGVCGDILGRVGVDGKWQVRKENVDWGCTEGGVSDDWDEAGEEVYGDEDDSDDMMS